PIAVLQDGDIININIPERTLNVALSAQEIQDRLRELPPFTPKITHGYLGRYARMVTSANEGAVLK
ncbi:MAG TPA: dihydroxy-acid dehydratase, partial [Candidatus Marinimicrobia bacterium]|nr:dihydroxy-acid dehydratase [Candidatus Neomarinimicrobiota bacterium]